MNKVELKNGSQTIYVSSAKDAVRSKSIQLITFYCRQCKCIHVNHPIKNVLWNGDSDDPLMCKEGFDAVLKPFTSI